MIFAPTLLPSAKPALADHARGTRLAAACGACTINCGIGRRSSTVYEKRGARFRYG